MLKTCLFFDTETTGPKTNADPTSEKNDKVIQLYASLYDVDTDEDYVEERNGRFVCFAKPVSSINLIINQEMVVPRGAYDVHGIDLEMQQLFGVKPKEAATIFNGMLDAADEVICHNVFFDERMAAHLFHQADMTWDPSAFDLFCTMKAMTPVCKLPPYKRGSYKWPNLTEAHTFIYGYGFEGAHDASFDTMACVNVYFGYHYLQKLQKEAA